MVSRHSGPLAPSGIKLTQRQHEVVQFVEGFALREGRAPSRADIAEHFGFNRASAQQHVAALVRHGVLRHLPGARGIKLAQPTSGPRMIPILGRVRAGVPLEAIEDRDGEIEVPSQMFRQQPDLMLRVVGDSMKDAGIVEGDLAAIRLQHAAESGQIVVARLGDEITIKRLRKRANTIELVAENPAYAPIRVGSGQDFSVEGIVLGVLRRL